MSSLMKVFTGVPQSKLAATALLIAVLVVGGVLLFSKNKVPFGERLIIILLMILFSLPSILLSLFQMTCLVTGAGMQNQRWWCAIYAWFISFLIVLYCALVVIVVIMSLVSDKKVEKFIVEKKAEKFANREKFEGGLPDKLKASQDYAEKFFANKEHFEGESAPVSLEGLKKKLADMGNAVSGASASVTPEAKPVPVKAVEPAVPVKAAPSVVPSVPAPSTPETFTSSGSPF